MFNEDQADTTIQPQEHKHSWLRRILEQLNTEFPLSGAETNKDLHIFSHHEATQKQEPEHKHSWLGNALGKIDAQFPLSGGE